MHGDEAARWVAVRYDEDRTVLEAVFNLSPEGTPVPTAGHEVWELVLSTDAAEYGGRGRAALAGRGLDLPGHSAVLLRRTRA